MVVLSQPPSQNLSPTKPCKPTTPPPFTETIPVINLKSPEAKSLLVKACEEYGFFKAINHGVPLSLMAKLESEALKFFHLPQFEKDQSGPPNPFGYGNKLIGSNGDVGLVEYLLFSASPGFDLQNFSSIFLENSDTFRCGVNDYISEVKSVACEVLELIGDELKIEPKNVMSKMLKDEKNDSSFRLNHYPAWPEILQNLKGKNKVGFGEHTDPQIISVLRSNNTSGLQISLRDDDDDDDGSWLPVPPDENSFFIIVGDLLQVMTNGRFKSVKHRVLLAESKTSRVSMVYFGGPPLNEKIAPIPSLMEQEGEESLYKEFTWFEYKNCAFNSRLAHNRLLHFEKSIAP